MNIESGCGESRNNYGNYCLTESQKVNSKEELKPLRPNVTKPLKIDLLP